MSFVASSLYSNRHILTRGISRSPPALHKDKKASNQGKKGQKLIFICSVLSYPRIFGDSKRQKLNIFLKVGAICGAGCGSACPPFGMSAGVGLQASGPEECRLWSSGRVLPPFARFPALLVVCCA